MIIQKYRLKDVRERIHRMNLSYVTDDVADVEGDIESKELTKRIRKYKPDIKRKVNTVGAGDALFPSFLHFYIASGKPEESLVKD